MMGREKYGKGEKQLVPWSISHHLSWWRRYGCRGTRGCHWKQAAVVCWWCECPAGWIPVFLLAFPWKETIIVLKNSNKPIRSGQINSLVLFFFKESTDELSNTYKGLKEHRKQVKWMIAEFFLRQEPSGGSRCIIVTVYNQQMYMQRVYNKVQSAGYTQWCDRSSGRNCDACRTALGSAPAGCCGTDRDKRIKTWSVSQK